MEPESEEVGAEVEINSSESASAKAPSRDLVSRFPWLTFEVLNTRSTMGPEEVARLSTGNLQGFSVCAPGEEEPVCTGRDPEEPSFFFFYRDLITKVGIRFPFTEFQINVLNHLHIAPSQLHPNGWGFVRAFERFCAYLSVTCTVPLFFYFFAAYVSRTGKEPPGQKGWINIRGRTSSRRRSKRLFHVFSESFKDFKPHFFKVVAQVGKRPWFLSSVEGEEGRFPLYWSNDYHQFPPATYLFKETQLSDAEASAAAALIAYVDGHGLMSASSLVFKSQSELDAELSIAY